MELSTRAWSFDATGAPGGSDALERGCRCSVLANAAFRAGEVGIEPLVDPLCGLHRASADEPSTPVTSVGRRPDPVSAPDATDLAGAA